MICRQAELKRNRFISTRIVRQSKLKTTLLGSLDFLLFDFLTKIKYKWKILLFRMAALGRLYKK